MGPPDPKTFRGQCGSRSVATLSSDRPVNGIAFCYPFHMVNLLCIILILLRSIKAQFEVEVCYRRHSGCCLEPVAGNRRDEEPQRDLIGAHSKLAPEMEFILRLIVIGLVLKCWYRAYCIVCYPYNKRNQCNIRPTFELEGCSHQPHLLPTSQWTRFGVTCQGGYLRPL